jgi:pseudaminic acid cytidylyltransferase
MKAIAIIPARGGSKRILHKNIREFCGLPILAYPVRVALQSELFNRVVVSTDSRHVAAIALQFGAEVVDRPSDLADDHASLREVMAYEAQRFISSDAPSYICYLLPTAVFATFDVLRSGAAIMRGAKFDHALTAVPFSKPVQRAFVQTPSGGTRMLMPQHYSDRSQDLAIAYHDAGQCYWGKPDSLAVATTDYFSERTALVPMDRNLVVDIDTLADWEIAEARYRMAHEQAS